MEDKDLDKKDQFKRERPKKAIVALLVPAALVMVVLFILLLAQVSL